MSEMRWDPVRQEWVIMSKQRMDRTFLPPKEYCPLCPTQNRNIPTEIPRNDFEIVVFENRFPSFSMSPASPAVEETTIYPVEPGVGNCEVVVYTPEHQGSLATLSKEKVINLIRVWGDRYEQLGKKDEIKYVLIFENRGEEVGVTLHHPHGQIYAFPYIPPIPSQELSSAQEYRDKNNSCLFCDMLKTEENDGSRVVTSNNSFIAFVPFYARYPFEVHIYSREHKVSINSFSNTEITDLAHILQKTVKAYDALFNQTFPYIMVIHQDPPGSLLRLGHLHFEFYPPLRDKGKLKYLAGCEQGGGSFINDSLPEEKAKQLREVLAGDIKSGD